MKHNKILFFAILFALFAIIYVRVTEGLNLPGMSKDTTIKDYVEREQESKVENSRDPHGIRAASLNKKPWLSDNINDMESLSWPDFGGRDIPPVPPLNDDGTREYPPYGGCAFYSPNIVLDCSKPYDVRFGIIRGIIDEIWVTGPFASWGMTDPFTITIQPVIDTSSEYGHEIHVKAHSVSDVPGDDSEGYCETIVQLLCCHIYHYDWQWYKAQWGCIEYYTIVGLYKTQEEAYEAASEQAAQADWDFHSNMCYLNPSSPGVAGCGIMFSIPCYHDYRVRQDDYSPGCAYNKLYLYPVNDEE